MTELIPTVDEINASMMKNGNFKLAANAIDGPISG